MRRQHRFLLSLLSCLLLTSTLTPPARGAWPSDPSVNVPLCVMPDLQYDTEMCSDGAGGAIVTWADRRTEGEQVYLQRISSAGVPMWTTHGILVSTASSDQSGPSICSDGSGGAIIAFEDYRSSSGTSTDIYVQRVNASGVFQWGTEGLALCTATGAQTDPVVCPDGAHGVVVAWEDARSGAATDIYVRRVNTFGTRLWTSNGVAVCTSAETQQRIAIVPEGTGGAVIAWQDNRSGTWDVYGCRVNGAGNVLWTANGVPLSAGTGQQTLPEMISDGLGGAIVVLGDDRNGDMDVCAQHVDASGALQWTSSGQAVCSATGDQTNPQPVSDGSGGVVVAWTDSRSGTESNIYTQRLKRDGVPQWTANGVSLCTASGLQFLPVIASDDAGGAIVAWQDMRGGELGYVYARRVSAGGVAQWASNGVAVCAFGDNSGVRLVPNGSGGAVLSWSSKRPGGTNDTYAQRVDRFGAIGEAEPDLLTVQDVTHDQGGQVVLEWTASYLDIEPTFGIDDYAIWRQVPTTSAALARAAVSPASEAAWTGRRALRATTLGSQTTYWEYVGNVPARGRAGYSFVAPTTADSMAGANALTRFMISAEIASSGYYWDSAPDSGYSVDNLAPAAPSPFTGQYAAGSTTMEWGPSAAPDFAVFQLHRGSTADFVPGEENLVATLAARTYVDVAGVPAYYKLCAVDVHGNVGAYATLLPSGALDVPGTTLPGELELSAPAPNPLRGSTTLRLALPRAARVALDVYDQQGRRLCELLSGRQPAGEHVVVWDGRDAGGRAVASGIYFVHCVVEGKTFTRRVAALR